MILDADLSVPPEMMTRFYDAIASGKGEFINGSRLVYPMQDKAMRPLNFIANRIFALLFSYLLNQRFTDTLCGTKVFRRRSYERIAEARSYLGDFDPFGDFDLVFGAPSRACASSRCRSITWRALTARRRSRAFATAWLWCAWWSSPGAS